MVMKNKTFLIKNSKLLKLTFYQTAVGGESMYKKPLKKKSCFNLNLFDSKFMLNQCNAGKRKIERS